MAWILTALAEMWRQRTRFVLPVVLGALLMGLYAAKQEPLYEAKVLLQVQSDQTRSPLLQHISAPGQEAALKEILSTPQLLADTGHDLKTPIAPERLRLRVVNDQLMEVGYLSPREEGLAQLVDALAYNFIQALLAPERIRIEQLMVQNQQEVKELNGRLATSDGKDTATRAELEARRAKLQGDLVQLQGDLRHVNTAFGPQGSQTLIWFSETARVTPPVDGWVRMLGHIILGGLLGFAFGWLVHEAPKRHRSVVKDATGVHDACGMPLLGTLPWLGRIKVSHHGLHVLAQGKSLRPSEFSEMGRLQRTLVRSLRRPLVLLGVTGDEGVTSLALLLAERTAAQGKSVALVDMNLKNRTLSHWLGLGDGNWELPKGKKGKWEALQPVSGHPNLKVLAAPRHPDTMSKLGEAGGLPVLFDLLGEMADVVIVDGSPLAAVNRGNVDAVSLAAASGRTVLLAQADVTPAHELKQAADSLLLVGAPLLGVVLNQQFSLSRRQLLAQMADRVGKVLPPLGKLLRRGSLRVKE